MLWQNEDVTCGITTPMHSMRYVCPETWAEKLTKKNQSYGKTAYIAVFVAVIAGIMTAFVHAPCFMWSVIILAAAIAGGCCGGVMQTVYNARAILDIDNDAETYVKVMELAESRCIWILSGWCRKERIRGLIAAGRIEEAEKILIEDEKAKGITNLSYKAERYGMLGLCAIAHDDMETLERCENELIKRRNSDWRTAALYINEWRKAAKARAND